MLRRPYPLASSWPWWNFTRTFLIRTVTSGLKQMPRWNMWFTRQGNLATRRGRVRARRSRSRRD